MSLTERGPQPSAGRPLAGITIVCFGGVDWDSHPQRPHHLISAFASRGASIVYVDNLGTRLPRWSDLPRVRRRLKTVVSARHTPRMTRGGRVKVYSPLVPPGGLPGLTTASATSMARHLRGSVDGRIVVWTYLPLPAVRAVANRLEADLLVYDWCDDASARSLAKGAYRKRKIGRWEDAMATEADLVFVAAEEMLRRRRPANPNTHLIAHGVVAGHQVGPAPESVLNMPGPRIGYIGTIGRWTDTELLRRLAVASPEWSFVLVGPVRKPVGELERLENVLMMGERPHEEVPSLLSAFDAAVVPYLVSDSTTSASPLKVREYLQHGVPVVSVDLPDIRPLSPPVRLASGPVGFKEQLTAAMAGSTPDPSSSIGSWDDRAEWMAELLLERLRNRPQ